MKIRNGFVSNSSSSSFLVGIAKECVTFEDFLKHGIYPYDEACEKFDLHSSVSNCDMYSKKPETYFGCLKKLWNDIFLNNVKATMEDWIDHMDSGDIPSGNLLFDYTFVDILCCPHNVSNIYQRIYGDKLAKKIEGNLIRIGKEWNSIIGEAMIRDTFDMFDGNVYEVHYSDNDGEGLMEHGSFWRFVPHIRISHH